ncbi:MAG TPA: hypothetical protein VF765_12890 [Polyangiaceae bacterium]
MRRLLLARVVGLVVLCTSISAEGAQPKKRRPPAKPTAPAQAPAQTTAPNAVAVTVVETAGTRAYVQPGATAGVRRNSTITIRGKDYTVVDASDSYAVVETNGETLHEQEKGRATVVAEEEQKAVELPVPHPLSTWQQAWTPEEAPAEAQQPRFVPLGGEERNRRFDVRFTLAAGGIIPLGGQVGSALSMGELNARLHAEPFAAPVTLDLDASLQGWAAADLSNRVGGPSRPLLYVRELLAGYTVGSFYAGIGRMRYAASTLGTLDGARVQQGLGEGFSIGAFGGLLPNALSGAPSLDAQRFGVEARYGRPDLALRPEAALVVHGSTFGGTLDERRVSGVFGLYPGPSRFGGYFEVSSFDADNPWKQPAIALTAAGIDNSVRLGSFELGARVDVRQPEMSRWLASYLPQSWFCTTVPAPGSNPTAPEACNGKIDTRALGEIDGSFAIEHLSLTLGGLGITDVTQTSEPNMVGGFATARLLRLARVLRFEASGNYSHSTFMNLFGGSAGPGLSLIADTLDVYAYYRLSVLQYRSDGASLLQDGIGGTIVVLPSSDLLFTLQGEGITGDDAKALTIFGTATWRPHL